MKFLPDKYVTHKSYGIEQLRIAGLLMVCLLYVAASWSLVSSRAMTLDQEKGAKRDQNTVEARAVVDRIEGATGVLYMGEEEDEKLDVPIKYLPAGVKQGAVLKITVEIDREATQGLEKNIEQLQKRLKDQ